MAESTYDIGDLSRKPLPDLPGEHSLDISPVASIRRTFQRERSWNSPYVELETYESIPSEHEFSESGVSRESNVRGLGLRNIPAETNRIKRVPVGSKDNLRQLPLPPPVGIATGSADSSGLLSQTTTANNTPADRLNGHDLGVKWPTPQSSHQSLKDSALRHIPSDGALLEHSHGEHHCGGCPTHGDVLKTRFDWFTVTILLLSFYSTVFSSLFLGVALAKPRYGHYIGTHGKLSISGATLLSALFSKTVELSFATVFVATLGQMLSRKAFVSDALSRARGAGISIAQMNMRLWIMQPGTLITNWIGVRYALPTVLGAVTFIATLSAIFYTTAAEALVSPKLRMGPWENRELSGQVGASYANSVYMSNHCQTPISVAMDSQQDRGGTCLQIVHAGQGFHNFESWTAQWAKKIQTGQTQPDDGRPAPLATLYENTTVYGQWITPSHENITTDSKSWARLLHNVTMAMPHANLFHAVRDPVNGIIQPEDLQGAGEYVVRAAIPAPAVNVLCAGLSADELAPMIKDNNTKSVPQRSFTTALDKIFGWQPVDQITTGEAAPWFDKAPKEYNTVGNFSNLWGPSGIYLLANPPNATVTNDYVLCSMRSFQYPCCTTSYHVAESGGNLTVHCDSDPENTLPYSKVVPTAPVGQIEKNWKDVAIDWVRAVALTHGVNDADAAIARMLTQMIPAYNNETYAKLRSGGPSYGEGLGVLAGCTLLLSSNDAPFQHEWTFSDEPPYSLNEPQYERFQALVAYKDYASGWSQRYQAIFYLVLLSTFFLNVWALAYLSFNFWHSGHVTDYTEPQNLFALAINSPPSNMLAGACGGGPSGDMLGKKWYVDMSQQQESTTPMQSRSNIDLATGANIGVRTTTGPSHPHFYVRSADDVDMINTSSSHPYVSPNADASWSMTPATPYEPTRVRFASPLKSPRFGFGGAKSRSKTRLSKPKSMEDFTVDESPAVQQYLRLIHKG